MIQPYLTLFLYRVDNLPMRFCYNRPHMVCRGDPPVAFREDGLCEKPNITFRQDDHEGSPLPVSVLKRNIPYDAI